MRVGIIDLGTNTFNLLIAEVGKNAFNVIHTEKEGVALGMGGINENVLADDAIERALTTLKRYKTICIEKEVEVIDSFGTSAIRDAQNAESFLLLVKNTLDIEIQIISGIEEAQLIYQGVLWSHEFTKPAVIMDVGGGSTEFILADSEGFKKAESLNIGVSRIYQAFEFSDPLSKVDIEKIEFWLDKNTAGRLDDMKCEILIGSSGTFETFYELLHESEFPRTIDAVSMTKDEMNDVLNSVLQSTYEERTKNPYIIPIRQKMAPIAAVKISWVMRKLGIKEVLISPCSLKEGGLRKHLT